MTQPTQHLLKRAECTGERAMEKRAKGCRKGVRRVEAEEGGREATKACVCVCVSAIERKRVSERKRQTGREEESEEKREMRSD